MCGMKWRRMAGCPEQGIASAGFFNPDTSLVAHSTSQGTFCAMEI
jgi:hypothetical protein